MFVGLAPLIIFFAKKQWEPAEYANYLMPWAYRVRLFDPDPIVVLTAVAAMLGFTAVYLYMGLRHFERRDL